MKKENIRWRWVYHDVYGLRLFLDVIYPKKETCTKQHEIFTFELTDIKHRPEGVRSPENILKLIGGMTIPPMPDEFKKWMK